MVPRCGSGVCHISTSNRSNRCKYNILVILPVSIALASFAFHCSATSLANGSSGLGALSNACIESNTVRI